MKTREEKIADLTRQVEEIEGALRELKRVPREWWVNTYPNGTVGGIYDSVDRADLMANDCRVLVHVREVFP